MIRWLKEKIIIEKRIKKKKDEETIKRIYMEGSKKICPRKKMEEGSEKYKERKEKRR